MKRASEETAIDQHHDQSLPLGSASKKFKPSSSGLDGNALAEDGIQVITSEAFFTELLAEQISVQFMFPYLLSILISI